MPAGRRFQLLTTRRSIGSRPSCDAVFFFFFLQSLLFLSASGVSRLPPSLTCGQVAQPSLVVKDTELKVTSHLLGNVCVCVSNPSPGACSIHGSKICSTCCPAMLSDCDKASKKLAADMAVCVQHTQTHTHTHTLTPLAVPNR